MANFFSNLFGGGKKVDNTYTGAKPPHSLLPLPGGQEYFNSITDRLAGRNVGFGDDYASIYSSPIVKNMRNQFESYTIPELTSELSATGRRRGSAGFGQIANAYKDQGLQEGDVFSRLQMRNEDQKRNEINDALGRVGQFNKDEANVNTGYANFDYADRTRKMAADQAQNYKEAEANTRLFQAGTDFLAPYINRMVPSSNSGVFNYGNSSYPISTVPYGYNLNLNSPRIAKQAQIGRAVA